LTEVTSSGESCCLVTVLRLMCCSYVLLSVCTDVLLRIRCCRRCRRRYQRSYRSLSSTTSIILGMVPWDIDICIQRFV
jgi:hypothetical protein